MDIGQVLENAILGRDQQIRSQAEAQLEEAARDHFVPYLGMLTEALGSSGQRTEVRILASIALKNQLTAKDPRTKAFQADRWVNLSAEAKDQIKKTSLDVLVSDDERVANAAAQLVAAIAHIELPRSEWPTLIPALTENTKLDKPTQVKRASLLTIGYICETADPNDAGVASQADGILTAIVQGAHSQEPSTMVRTTAINALVNSLEFVRRNFENDNERDVIMQVVCEATQSESTELQASAFGALGRIMALYYDFMRRYMEQALFGLTVSGMQSSDDMVASMAVEFWSTVCEEELEIKMDMEEILQSGASATVPPRELHNFAQNALDKVLPTLLSLLTRQDEDSSEDDWSVAMAAGACLQLFAQTTGNLIVPKTLEFVSGNISAEHWQQREAAVMAFGSILDGPNPQELQVLIGQALRPILSLMKDQSLQVKDTVAWCIGRMAELVIDGINVEADLPVIIEAVLHGLSDHPRVSVNCCWTIMNLVDQLGHNGPEVASTPMSQFYEPLVRALLDAASRSDNEYNCRTSAYEALSSLVIFSAQDVQVIVEGLSGEVLSRLEAAMGMQQQIVGTEDKVNIEELQINLLGVLTNVIRRIDSRVGGAAEKLMTLFLQLLENKLPNSLVEEDVFIAIGAMAGAINGDFQKFMPAFLPYLGRALSDPEYQIVSTAVGLVADVSHALGAATTEYAQTFMTAFIAILQKEDAPLETKPVVLSCIGDVASSVGGAFAPYLETMMAILVQASQISFNPESSSMEFLDYVDRLRESIVDAYVGIVAGMRDNAPELLPYVPSIFNFLSAIQGDVEFMRSESVIRSVVGLIGDIASMYPKGEVKQYYHEQWITDIIRRARDRIFSATTKETARWAREQQRQQLLL
uniref:Importin-95 n=1 Tax=Blastobotrys adeninivorans TaxID=409370 RepID=A0A060T6W5_BLAAD